MTPTLWGRWQTRLAVFILAALPVALGFAWSLGDRDGLARAPLVFVALMLGLGLVLDPVYDQLQRLRWDQDWPYALIALDGVLEFALAFAAFRLDLLPGVESCRLARIDRLTRELVCLDYALPLSVALLQLVVVTGATLVFIVGVVPVLVPRWRFHGGEFGRFGAADD